jgi:hypothetical protein
VILREKEEEAVAEHGKSRNSVGVSATSFIFEQASIFTPVITDLYTTPMAANYIQPLLGSILLNRQGTDVIAWGFVFRVFERGGIAFNQDDGSCVGEIDIQRVYRSKSNGSMVCPAMLFFCLGKRGAIFFVWAIAD